MSCGVHGSLGDGVVDVAVRVRCAFAPLGVCVVACVGS